MQFEPVKTLAIEISGTTAVVVESKTSNIVLDPTASPGPQGKPGRDGVDGLPGRDGADGEPGLPGPIGEQGPQGPQGAKGDRGATGSKGDRGLTGVQGLQGEQGPQGERGEAGDLGPQGEIGEQGPQGERGVQGLPGVQGERGLQGETGASADPAVVNNLTTRVDALTNNIKDIINLAPETLNAFSEVASALNNDPQFAQTMTTALANRIRYDAAQNLTATQRAVARSNVDAAAMSDLTARLSRDAYVRTLQAVSARKPPANALIGGGFVAQAGFIDASSSAFRADTAPTGAATLSVMVNGVSRGTIAFTAGSVTASINIANGTLNPNDYLAIYAPATVDSTLAGIIGGLVVRL